jgi:hypothetical protein
MSTPGSGIPPPAEGSQSTETSDIDSQSAYNDLRRLIPPLAAELDHLRASLREHNLWLLRYGHSNNPPVDPIVPPTSSPDPGQTGGNANASELPAYSASDVPPYRGTREEVAERRDQLTEWLKEGEDVLREYSARYAQLAAELQMPAEDLLGTWRDSAPDNTLPDYERVEEREELMVGGVGEVPPPYHRSSFSSR